MQFNKRLVNLIALILAGESIFFLPFVFARVFRVSLLEVYAISNLELGQYFSFYGLVAMASYMLGGPFSDKYQPHKLISLSLLATALGGFVLAAFPQKEFLFWIYGWWGFSTIFFFWSPLIKATRNWGAEHLQGKAFGFLEAGRGFTAAAIALLVLFSFTGIKAEGEVIFEERVQSYRFVMFLSSMLTAGVAALAYFSIPPVEIRTSHNPFTLIKIKPLASRIEIWLLAVIIICSYSGYKITDVISIYAKDVLFFTENQASQTSMMVLWLRPLCALIIGIIADKYMANKTIPYLLALIIIGSGFLLINPMLFPIALIFVFVSLTVIGIYGVRSIYFALVKESNIPFYITGTAVGIVSFLGFTPDVFISPLIGYLIDNNPGFRGYQLVFLVLLGFAILGLTASAIMHSRLNKPSFASVD